MIPWLYLNDVDPTAMFPVGVFWAGVASDQIYSFDVRSEELSSTTVATGDYPAGVDPAAYVSYNDSYLTALMDGDGDYCLVQGGGAGAFSVSGAKSVSPPTAGEVANMMIGPSSIYVEWDDGVVSSHNLSAGGGAAWYVAPPVYSGGLLLPLTGSLWLAGIDPYITLMNEDTEVESVLLEGTWDDLRAHVVSAGQAVVFGSRHTAACGDEFGYMTFTYSESGLTLQAGPTFLATNPGTTGVAFFGNTALLTDTTGGGGA